jgi:hypothetical protein
VFRNDARAAIVAWVSEWIVQPFESLGPLRIGASRAEVRAAMDEAPREFEKGGDANPVEAYATAGVHAYYDGAGRLEFLEAFDPSRPVYANVQLLSPDATSALAKLSELGLVGRDDGERGVWFDDHGFALFVPAEASEAVSVFRRGYDTGT